MKIGYKSVECRRMVTINSLRTPSKNPSMFAGVFDDFIDFIEYFYVFLLSIKSIDNYSLNRFNEFINKKHLSIILKVQRNY